MVLPMFADIEKCDWHTPKKWDKLYFFVNVQNSDEIMQYHQGMQDSHNLLLHHSDYMTSKQIELQREKNSSIRTKTAKKL
jgi:hypothetical protein